MLYFQIFVVAVGLFILSDPFKAVTIEEETASGEWQVVPAITAKPTAKPKALPIQEDLKLEDKKESKSQKTAEKPDLTNEAIKAALEEFKPEVIIKAVKETHAARLEETEKRKEDRKAAGIISTRLDSVLDVVIPSVKKGFSFIFSEVLPRAFNVAVKTAPIWLPMVLALL